MKKSIGWILIIFLLCFMSYGRGFERGAQAKTSTESSAITRAATLENTLTKWVFSHSSKISQGTAREIAREALKTKRPLFIAAVAAAESEFVPTATSPQGAKGLMQVMWKYHSKALITANIAREERDLYDVDVSIRAGSLILNDFLKQSNGDVGAALVQYLGKKDGYYYSKILANLGSLYVLIT